MKRLNLILLLLAACYLSCSNPFFPELKVREKPVTIVELQELLDDAEDIKDEVSTSEDGSDVDKDDWWVTQEELDALEDAIKNAEEAIKNGGNLDDIYDELEKAIDEFNNAKKSGTKDKTCEVCEEEPCVCDDGDETCEVCETEPCVCNDGDETCEVCEEEPCVCDDGDETCEICETEPCVCDDGDETCEVCETEPCVCTVAKADGAGVTKPVVSGTPSHNSITVGAVTLQTATGQSVQYAASTNGGLTGAALDSLTWQAGTTFTGLLADTGYYVFARSVENDDYNAGTPSISAKILTSASRTITINFENIAEGAPNLNDVEDIIISRSGADGDKTKPFTLSNPEQYSSIKWLVDGVEKSTAVSFALDASDISYNTIGLHTLTLRVTIDGVPYNTTIEFEVKQ